MIRLVFLLLLVGGTADAQTYDAYKIFAHNDYETPVPFHTAFDHGVGHIEADVFLVGDQLMVAHHRHQIKEGRTLTSLYLKPLSEKVSSVQSQYSEEQPLTLMIDIKTEGPATLRAIVNELKESKDLLGCPWLMFMISGNVPDPATWNQYPDFITFDGRPNIEYTSDQLKRIPMISSSFGSYSRWNGTGELPEKDRQSLEKVVQKVHSLGKKVRFWASPDNEKGWELLMDLGVDVIVTDKVGGLSEFLD